MSARNGKAAPPTSRTKAGLRPTPTRPDAKGGRRKGVDDILRSHVEPHRLVHRLVKRQASRARRSDAGFSTSVARRRRESMDLHVEAFMIVDEVENVTRVPPKRSNLTTMRTSPGRMKSRIEASSAATTPGAARHRLGSDERAACAFELGLLGRCVLSRGGHAGLANQAGVPASGRRDTRRGLAGLRSLRWAAGCNSGGK
jgi:hypothetical protein